MKKSKMTNSFLKKVSFELYCFILLAITLITWRFSSLIGISLLSIIGIFVLIYIKDFNYLVPIFLNLIFIHGDDYVMDIYKSSLWIPAVIFVILLIVYTFTKKIDMKKSKQFIPLLILGIVSFIPIFWTNCFNLNANIMIVFYFAIYMYLLIYFVFSQNLGTVSIDKIIISFMCVGLVISLQVFYTVLIANKSCEYYAFKLGWGISNEAGILLLFFLPFVFYNLSKCQNLKRYFLNIFILVLNLFAIFLTGSRGTYLFGFLEIGLLLFASYFKSSDKRLYFTTVGAFAFSAILLYLYKFDYFNHFIKDVFYNGMGDSGRFSLYEDALKLFLDNPRNFILGSGFISEFDKYNRLQVYHSTFFQTIVLGGVLGLGCLIYHLVIKYKFFIKNHSDLYMFLLIGFVVIDLYGLIDNTYYMYYFMFPLMIILAVMDNDNENSKEQISNETSV